MAAVDTHPSLSAKALMLRTEQSRDPIAAAARFITTLQSIKSRNIKAS